MFNAGTRLFTNAQHWFVGCPLFLPLITGAVSLIGYVCQSYLLGLLAVLLLLVCVSLNKRISLLCLVFSLSVVALHHHSMESSKQIESVAIDSQRVELTGTVTRVLRNGGCLLKTESVNGEKLHSKVYLRYADKVSIADKLEGDFWIRQPRKPRNPGEFNEAAWLKHQGVAAVVSGKASVVGHSVVRLPLRWLASLRGAVKMKLSDGVVQEDSVKVIHSMFLGERYGSKDPIILDYRHSGAMHVFAVSGLHVMMVGLIVMMLCRFCRLGRRLAIPLVIVMMACYAGVTGWGTPAVRALIMATVFLSGYLFRRKPRLMNSMAASAMVVLLLDPQQLFSPGFQLSYVVVFTIVLLADWWQKRLRWIHYIEPFLPRSLYTWWQSAWLKARTWFSGSLAVSFAAWMGSTPLIAYHFKMFSPVGLLIGVPMVVTLFTVMSLSCLSLILGTIHSSFARPINHLNGIVAGWSYDIASGAASLKGGHYLHQETLDGKVVIMDVKRGGSVYLGLGGGVLLDGGSEKNSGAVLKTLQLYHARLDSCILSHGDSEHSFGLMEVLERYKIKQLMVPARKFGSQPSMELLGLAEKQEVKVVTSLMGQSYELEDGVSLQVLCSGALRNGVTADDRGLVLMLDWHGCKVLMMNDAGFYLQKCMLEAGVELQSDVLIIGKNVEEEFYHADFYKAVGARVIIATDYQYDHREQRVKRWRKNLSKTGAKVFYQSKDGAVVLSLNGGKLQVDSQLTGDRFNIDVR